MQWFKQQSASDWTAIRCNNNHICVAQVQKRVESKPYVNFAEIREINVNQENQLKALVNQYQLKKSQCALVLDANEYQMLQIEKPNVPEEEQRQAVRWKIKDMIDYPVEQATVDLLTIPTDPAHPNREAFAYAIAAKNALIGSITNQLIDANVNLKAVDIQVTAQRNIAHLLEQKDRGVAMLSFNHVGGLLTFTAGGELYHARFIEIEEARTAGASERIALELQRSLDHFDRQFPFIAVNKLLVAPFEDLDTFVPHLKSALYVQVETFDLRDVFDFSETTHIESLRDQASLLPVLGAALRQEILV